MISGWSPTLDMNNALPATLDAKRGLQGRDHRRRTAPRNSLYAADFVGRKIDVFDSSFAAAAGFAGKFKDPGIPADYGPFNVQNILGNIYVTYAKTQPSSDDEAHGKGLGFVDVYDADGNLLSHARAARQAQRAVGRGARAERLRQVQQPRAGRQLR